MPELKWIGKDKVINHDGEVPFHLLKEREELSVNSNNTENLLIKGDNLLALKSLLPYYYNKIKCIYIDPPYNTGNEKWVYNDNVNSPEMKKWLGKVVGSEGEDLCRHDKWLCMMYPRMKLLRDLLSDDGVIFVSINDSEVTNLRIIMNEIFGEQNIELMVWYKIPEEGTAGQGKMKITHRFRLDHEYIVVCYKNKKDTKFNKPLRLKKVKNIYGNPDNDSRGDWMSCEICKSEIKSNPQGKNYYSIKTSSGRKIERQWHISYEDFLELDKDKRIYWGSGKSVPRLKKFLGEPALTTPTSLISNISQTEANNELKELFGEKKFDNPKPINLIKWLLEISSNKNDIILDSFAGSGTTGHAVLSLNNKDGYNRKFILVELEDEISDKVTAERLRRVIRGYSFNNNHIEGLGGGFKFMELDKPLFNKYKKLIGEPSYEELGSYIYFTETYQTINWKKFNKDDWYLGENKSTHYFLIYETKEQNELGENFLEIAQKYEGNKIAYSDVLMLDDDILNKYNIEFKQIPYEIKTF